MITLVTGGARSGKSTHALKLALAHENRVFMATAEMLDSEMGDRITKHQSERGDSFTTVEEPLDLANALRNIDDTTDVVLIDCLTVWVGNLMHKYGDEAKTFKEVDDLLDLLTSSAPCNIILVANEVGMGIVPDNKMARDFRDIAGRLNQDIAAIADTVLLTVSGLPLNLK